MDSLDYIIKQWHDECPELNTQAMALIGRLKKITAILCKEMEKNYIKFGLNASSFDVLATLKRSGKPYALSPSELILCSMVTSGTMTNRIDQLEKQGLVERTQNPNDARSFIIRLTQKGYTLITEAIKAHVDIQNNLLKNLSKQEVKSLNLLLGDFLSHLESE